MFPWRSLFLYEQNHLLHSLLLLGLSVNSQGDHSCRVDDGPCFLLEVYKEAQLAAWLGGMESCLDPSVAEMGPCECSFVSLWGLSKAFSRKAFPEVRSVNYMHLKL